ncbi:MAG: hypothetical protein JOZ77_05380 [Candidatus Eremiobacteraeota bacterium]|nr:hypothetical protein [Candidatus Eremiobacteraeota bacterium]
MIKYLCLTIGIILALQPAIAQAGPRGGGGGGGAMRGGGARPAGGGFNLSRDTARAPVSRPSQPAQRPAQPAQRPPTGNVSNGNRGNNGNVNNGNRNNGNVNNGNRNTNINNGNRTNVNVSGNTVIRNPVYVNNTAWGWNRGVAWYPAPYYWGGGFWGAFAIGAASAAVYGTIVANNTTYTSYHVQSNTPGWTFLLSYQLTQVPCGPSGLVVVYGPQNSVICATPNQLVGAGYYQLDTQTLTLTSIAG